MVNAVINAVIQIYTLNFKYICNWHLILNPCRVVKIKMTGKQVQKSVFALGLGLPSAVWMTWPDLEFLPSCATLLDY